MNIAYPNKRDPADILAHTPTPQLQTVQGQGAKNKLIQGDNLPILKKLLDDYEGMLNLVYIDPPFATNDNFTITEHRTSTISRARNGTIAYTDTLTGADYLEFLRERLIFLHRLLAPTGSIYVHIDYKIGHYVKIIMDEIFGPHNFRNDIARIKCNPKNFQRKSYGNIKDLILFYSKSSDPIWNDPRTPFSKEDEERLFKKIDNEGRRYTTIPLHAPGETQNGNTSKMWRHLKPPKGRHWRTDPTILEQWDQMGLIEWSSNGVPRKKIYLDERQGKKMQDIWDFKDPQYPSYPTEKNLELIKFIVEASSHEGDLVLDCFCGSGTTLIASQLLSRQWIGIDKSDIAITATRQRLHRIPTNLFAPLEYEFLKQTEPALLPTS